MNDERFETSGDRSARVAEFYGVSEEYARSVARAQERDRKIERKLTIKHSVRIVVMGAALVVFVVAGYKLWGAVVDWLNIPATVTGWLGWLVLAYIVNQTAQKINIRDPRDKD